ncbi:MULTISPECIES: hypothetical protein [Runella]|uniref:Uncharacterized protein n=1 Tax=Runella defluvii TaxID=370973 RepID=A0A7W5ZMT6_9BACT|nr:MULTISPECIES: hypothetical protein [Runella]MBB3838587.1 hypothetical protein [Runella defluvii]MCA0229065.1 hypothetical protein [Bacteroidota bacterium]
MATMLEFIKTVLVKVSFDKKLFEKELRKALKVLLPEDVKQLRAWCYERFSDKYTFILNQYFRRRRLSLN